MATVHLSPIWNGTRFFDNNGNLLASGKINAYSAGSFTNAQTTYSSMAGSTTNPADIELNANGLNITAIWLVAGSFYNLVLRDSNNNIISNVDNVYGIAPGI